MQLFLIGSSGSGKDTQAKMLSQYFNLRWMSVGDVLRERSTVNDTFGTYIKNIIDNGELLDWEHLQPIIDNQLAQRPHDFIWTGFPRLEDQAKYFDELVKDSKYKLDLVINLTVPEEVIKQRIEHRKETDVNIRKDDMDDSRIMKRVTWYNENISEIKEFYLQTNRFIDIDASGSVLEVFEETKRVIRDRFIR